MTLYQIAGNLNYKKLIGMIINNYEILDYFKNDDATYYDKKHNFKYRCLVCGYIGIKTIRCIQTKGCKKCQYNASVIPNVYEEITSRFMKMYMDSAKKRKLVFEITPQKLWEKFIEQEKRCYYTNIEIFFEKNGIERGLGNFTVSLDRIDPKFGYIEGNIQWVHRDVNKFKHKHSSEKYISICNLVDTFYGKFNVTKDYQPTKKHKYWNGCGEISGAEWSHVNDNAKATKSNLLVSIQDGWEKFLSQGMVCAMSGLPLYFSKSLKDLNRGIRTATLVRIDTSLDYTSDNIQWIHKDIANSMWGIDIDYYKKVCKMVAVKHPRDRSSIPLLETIK